MARKRLPEDALEYYYELGMGRSYRAVADHFGVSKTTVANRAERDGWPERVRGREAEVSRRLEKKAIESREEMEERHLKMLRLIQSKAVETLASTSLGSAFEAVRSLGLTIREERVIRGEPGERTAISVEDTIRREMDRWLVKPDASE